MLNLCGDEDLVGPRAHLLRDQPHLVKSDVSKPTWYRRMASIREQEPTMAGVIITDAVSGKAPIDSVVTVNGWAGQAPHDTKGPPSSSWDMHGGNMGMGDAFGTGSYGMGFCLPRLDQALGGLFSDLKERGMLENTLVVVTGEFGRTPKVLTQKPPGRQHWPKCFSSILAGAGIAGGQVYGKSDKHAAYVASNPIRPEEMAATIYHALDVPLNQPLNNNAISRLPTTGKPVMELFG